MTERLGVVEARDQLPDLIRRVKSTPAAVFEIGRYRRADAVLMAASQAVPPHLRQVLLRAFWCFEAERSLMSGDARRGAFYHAGDPVGAVLAWLWRSDPHLAVENLATYIAELRWDAPRRIRHGADRHGLHWPEIEPVSLNDVLGALAPALPADFERRDYEQLCALSRTEIPEILGDPAS